jgi:hypothetical protein
MELVTKASLAPSGEVTRLSMRNGEVAMARAPGLRSDSFSASDSTFVPWAAWRARASATSRAKIVSPGVARGEVERARIGGPGKGVDFLLTLGKRDGLAAGGRDQVDLADLSFIVFVFFIFGGFVVVGVGVFFCREFALGEKCDPAAVRRPFGIAIVAGLCELDQRGLDRRIGVRVIAIKPEIFAENFLVPVGAFGGDHYGVAVG